MREPPGSLGPPSSTTPFLLSTSDTWGPGAGRVRQVVGSQFFCQREWSMPKASTPTLPYGFSSTAWLAACTHLQLPAVAAVVACGASSRYGPGGA